MKSSEYFVAPLPDEASALVSIVLTGYNTLHNNGGGMCGHCINTICTPPITPVFTHNPR